MDSGEKIILVIFIILMIPFSVGLYLVLDNYDVKPITINWPDLSDWFDFKKPVEKPSIVDKKIVETPKVVNTPEVTETPKVVETPEISSPNQKLSNPPSVIKAIYVTTSSAESQNYFEYLDNLFAVTEINTVVIDIKDYSGRNKISFFDDIIKKLHDKGVYVIARIAVFEDQALAKNRPDLAIYDKLKTTDPKNPILWLDNNNLAWIDPASEEAWDYNIAIAKEAVNHGFDEINFDYIRFSSDGKIENMGFPFWDKKVPKHLVIKSFFQKLRESLPDVKLSADIFGYATVSTDDMGIGQVLEDSFDYFDYICPMVYPSHYRDGFRGYTNPAEYPYEVIKYSMQTALKRQTAYYDKLQTPEGTIINKAKFRPWLQDFDMGANYTTEMVKAEIKAVIDTSGENFYGFMLWNASNVYTEGAIKKP